MKHQEDTVTLPYPHLVCEMLVIISRLHDAMVSNLGLQASKQARTMLMNDRVLPCIPWWQVPALRLNLTSSIFRWHANYVSYDYCTRIALCHLHHSKNSVLTQNCFCNYDEWWCPVGHSNYIRSVKSLSTSNSPYFIPVSRTEPLGGTTKTEALITPWSGSCLTGGSGVGRTIALERRCKKDIIRGAWLFL